MNRLVSFIILLLLGWLVIVLVLFTGLYTEERLGKYGKPFRLLKLRTMSTNTEIPEAHRSNSLQKFLRSSKIDELPQLINIFKGDMGFIGPRPLPVRYWSRIPDDYKKRFDVLPGITGWVQVSGGNDLPWQQRFELDNEYVEGKSWLMDLRILALTVATVVRQKGRHLSEELQDSDFS